MSTCQSSPRGCSKSKFSLKGDEAAQLQTMGLHGFRCYITCQRAVRVLRLGPGSCAQIGELLHEGGPASVEGAGLLAGEAFDLLGCLTGPGILWGRVLECLRLDETRMVADAAPPGKWADVLHCLRLSPAQAQVRMLRHPPVLEHVLARYSRQHGCSQDPGALARPGQDELLGWPIHQSSMGHLHGADVLKGG